MIIFGILAVLLLAFVFFIILSSRPLDKATAITKINELVSSQVGKQTVTQAIVYIDSPRLSVSETFAYGKLNGSSIQVDQPFHVASVGKAFTATLIGILIDENKMTLTDRICSYLSNEVLDGLFVYQGTDYQDEVTVGQLLNHTSGIADYFADKTEGSPAIQELMINNPDTFWSPKQLVAFSQKFQTSVGSPGEKFHYSDTGYILLGMIIEHVSDLSFDTMLREKIFLPLHMNDSYLMFYSEPVNGLRPIADVHLAGANVKDYQSVSIDWAGGGIISTANDLATFIRALNNFEIISQKTLNNLYHFDHQYRSGIHYGYGFMEYQFGEFFPTLKSLPPFIGHMGILGTQMFYSKGTDMVYISSFGSDVFAAGSVRTFIKVLSILNRIK